MGRGQNTRSASDNAGIFPALIRNIRSGIGGSLRVAAPPGVTIRVSNKLEALLAEAVTVGGTLAIAILLLLFWDSARSDAAVTRDAVDPATASAPDAQSAIVAAGLPLEGLAQQSRAAGEAGWQAPVRQVRRDDRGARRIVVERTGFLGVVRTSKGRFFPVTSRGIAPAGYATVADWTTAEEDWRERAGRTNEDRFAHVIVANASPAEADALAAEAAKFAARYAKQRARYELPLLLSVSVQPLAATQVVRDRQIGPDVAIWNQVTMELEGDDDTPGVRIRVTWGRLPADALAGEPTEAEKFDRLARWFVKSRLDRTIARASAPMGAPVRSHHETSVDVRWE